MLVVGYVLEAMLKRLPEDPSFVDGRTLHTTVKLWISLSSQLCRLAPTVESYRCYSLALKAARRFGGSGHRKAWQNLGNTLSQKSTYPDSPELQSLALDAFDMALKESPPGHRHRTSQNALIEIWSIPAIWVLGSPSNLLL